MTRVGGGGGGYYTPRRPPRTFPRCRSVDYRRERTSSAPPRPTRRARPPTGRRANRASGGRRVAIVTEEGSSWESWRTRNGTRIITMTLQRATRSPSPRLLGRPRRNRRRGRLCRSCPDTRWVKVPYIAGTWSYLPIANRASSMRRPCDHWTSRSCSGATVVGCMASYATYSSMTVVADREEGGAINRAYDSRWIFREVPSP